MTKTPYLAIPLLIFQLGVSPLATADRHVDPPVVSHAVQGEFDNITGSLKFAIQNQGLVLSGTSHLQEMLERTATDLGYEKGIYLDAISYEFCSADLAHKMFNSDRRNVATCPMTIAAYVLPDAPDTVQLSYRNPVLATEDAELEGEIRALFEAIIEEATAW
ncbi:MAG: hypothetical protein U5S82_05810 [Gammaproteobacteria bacterium]|nr:hypothetical protein [Gammaproteobacteria bacterium]